MKKAFWNILKVSPAAALILLAGNMPLLVKLTEMSQALLSYLKSLTAWVR
jgi:hypothetical protein